MYKTAIRLFLTALLLAVGTICVAGVVHLRGEAGASPAAQAALAGCCLAALVGLAVLWTAPRKHSHDAQ